MLKNINKQYNTLFIIRYHNLSDAKTKAFKFIKNATLQDKVVQSLSEVNALIDISNELMSMTTVKWKQLTKKYDNELVAKRFLKHKEVLIKGYIAFIKFLNNFKHLLSRYIALENGNYFINTFYEKFSSYLLIMNSRIHLLIYKIDSFNDAIVKHEMKCLKKLNKASLKQIKVIHSTAANSIHAVYASNVLN